MKRMRVLIVTDDANMGGTYRVAEQLATGLGKFSDLHFACAFNDKNAASCAKIARGGAHMHDYQISERNLDRSAFAFPETEALLDDCNPDILLLIEAAEIWSLLALKQTAQRRKIPYVSVINLLSANCLERFVELRERSIEALNAAHAIIFVSNATRLRFEALFPEVDSVKHVVPNSCPDSFFLSERAEARLALRESLGIQEDEAVFLTAARIEPRKGQRLCVEALQRIRDREGVSGIRLAFAGGGLNGHMDNLQRAVEEKGLSENVIFLGPRSDIPDLLDASDVFMLASYAEGMPLSIIEAMAKGRPIVATAVDGIPEQIDEASGILVPSPTLSESACVDALADAMAYLRSDRPARCEMGRRAKQRATNLFSESRMFRDYQQILMEIRGSAFYRPSFGFTTIRRLFGQRRASSQIKLQAGDVIDFSNPLQCWNYARSGWNQTEEDGVWSDGARSHIKVRMQEKARVWRLTFDLTPFVPGGLHQATDILVNGKHIDSWVFDADARKSRSVDVPMKGAKDKRLLEIALVHKKSISPHAVDGSEDSRELALFLHSLKVEPALPLESRSVIYFSDPRRCWNYAKEGWHQAEGAGIWSDGALSVIQLRMRERRLCWRLTFDLTPFVPSGHRQDIDVVVNGNPLVCWIFGLQSRESLTVDVPMKDANDRRLLDIRLVHKKPMSPRAFNLGDDSRNLGVFLHAIKIEPAL